MLDFEEEELQTLKEKIKQRRAQVLVHSYIYYELNESLVSDGQWQGWADELIELHKIHNCVEFYDEAFKGWDGSTGMHLPKDDWVKNKAHRLLKLNNKK